jgi:hypothetical protein
VAAASAVAAAAFRPSVGAPRPPLASWPTGRAFISSSAARASAGIDSVPSSSAAATALHPPARRTCALETGQRRQLSPSFVLCSLWPGPRRLGGAESGGGGGGRRRRDCLFVDSEFTKRSRETARRRQSSCELLLSISGSPSPAATRQRSLIARYNKRRASSSPSFIRSLTSDATHANAGSPLRDVVVVATAAAVRPGSLSASRAGDESRRPAASSGTGHARRPIIGSTLHHHHRRPKKARRRRPRRSATLKQVCWPERAGRLRPCCCVNNSGRQRGQAEPSRAERGKDGGGGVSSRSPAGCSLECLMHASAIERARNGDQPCAPLAHSKPVVFVVISDRHGRPSAQPIGGGVFVPAS